MPLGVGGAEETAACSVGVDWAVGGAVTTGIDGGVTDKDKAQEKERREASCHAEGSTVRRKNPRVRSSVAVARAGVSCGGTAETDEAANGSSPQVLAWCRAAESGSNRQPGGNPKLAAARVIGKSRPSERLCIELERRAITASRSQSIGRPKIVLTVTSGPKAKERVTGEPAVSTQGA